jgi:hypothetical protein
MSHAIDPAKVLLWQENSHRLNNIKVTRKFIEVFIGDILRNAAAS